MRFLLLAIPLLWAAGCAPKEKFTDQDRAAIIAEIAVGTHMIFGSSDDLPIPAVCCGECKDGRVPTGDGLDTVPCPCPAECRCKGGTTVTRDADAECAECRVEN